MANHNIESADELLTYEELSPILKRSVGTLRHDVSRGRIPHVKIFGSVRFRRSDLDKFINDMSVPARGR